MDVMLRFCAGLAVRKGADKPMTLISLRLPKHVIDDLNEVAPSLGFGGYQALIRAYISNGLRKHLAELETQRAKDSTVEEFSWRFVARGCRRRP